MLSTLIIITTLVINMEDAILACTTDAECVELNEIELDGTEVKGGAK